MVILGERGDGRSHELVQRCTRVGFVRNGEREPVSGQRYGGGRTAAGVGGTGGGGSVAGGGGEGKWCSQFGEHGLQVGQDLPLLCNLFVETVRFFVLDTLELPTVPDGFLLALE